MKPPASKLQCQHQTEDNLTAQHGQQQTGREFANADEMLRYDASRTEVPPAVARRLAKSVRQQARPPKRPSGWGLLP